MIIIFCLVYLFGLFKKGNSDFFQPEVFLNLYFIVLIGLGPIALYFFSSEMYRSANFQHVAVIVMMGYVFINIGFYVAANTKDYRLFRPGKPWHSIGEHLDAKIKKASLAFVGLGILAGLIFFARAGNIPILAGNKELARVAALSVGGNGYFLYLMTFSMYGMALYATYSFSRDKDRWFLFAIFAVVGLIMTGTGSRRYLLWLCLYLLISRHYLAARLSNKLMFIYAGLGLLFINVFEMFRNPDSMTTVDLATTFTYRFVLYISNLEKVITAFVSKGNLEYGSTFFMDIITALPGKQLDYQSWLKEVTNLEFEGFGIPPTLMGDLYINFGYAGIVIGCVLFGYFVRKAYNRCILTHSGFYHTFLYMLILEVASKVITSGISAQSVSMLWLVIFLALLRIAFAVFAAKRNKLIRINLENPSLSAKY